MTLGQPIAERNSVINHWLTTATDGRNCLAARSTPLAIGPLPLLYTPCRESRLPDLCAMFPNWNALRSNLSWTHYRLLPGDIDPTATVSESLSVQTQGESQVRLMIHRLKQIESRQSRPSHG